MRTYTVYIYSTCNFKIILTRHIVPITFSDTVEYTTVQFLKMSLDRILCKYYYTVYTTMYIFFIVSC